jgi:hypothetical protein
MPPLYEQRERLWITWSARGRQARTIARDFKGILGNILTPVSPRCSKAFDSAAFSVITATLESAAITIAELTFFITSPEITASCVSSGTSFAALSPSSC